MPVALTPFYASSDNKTACVKLSDAIFDSYSGFTANLNLLWQDGGSARAIPTILIDTVAGAAEIYMSTNNEELAGPGWYIYDPNNPPTGSGELVDFFRTTVFLLKKPNDETTYLAYYAFGPINWSEGSEGGTASVNLGFIQSSACKEFVQLYLYPTLSNNQFMNDLYAKRWLAYDTATSGRRVVFKAFSGSGWDTIDEPYYIVGIDGREVHEENVMRAVMTSGGDPDVAHHVFYGLSLECADCGTITQTINHFTSVGGWAFAPFVGDDALALHVDMAAYGHPDEKAAVTLAASGDNELALTVNYNHAPMLAIVAYATRTDKYRYCYTYTPRSKYDDVIADCELVDIPTAKRLKFAKTGARWVSDTVTRYGDVTVILSSGADTTIDRASASWSPTEARCLELLGNDAYYTQIESENSIGLNIRQLSAAVGARLSNESVQVLYDKYNIDATCKRLLLKVAAIENAVYTLALKNNVVIYDFPSLHEANKLLAHNCTLTVENDLLKVVATDSNAYIDVLQPALFFHRHLKLTGLALEKVEAVGALDQDVIDWALVLCKRGSEGTLDYALYATTCAKSNVDVALSERLESYLDIVKYISEGFPQVKSSRSWSWGWHKVANVRLVLALQPNEHLYLDKLVGVYFSVASAPVLFELPAKRFAGERMEDGILHKYWDERQLALIVDNRIALELKRAHTNWTSTGEVWTYFRLTDLATYLDDPLGSSTVLALPKVKLESNDINYFNFGGIINEQELVNITERPLEEPPKFQHYNVEEINEYNWYYPPAELAAGYHVPLCFLSTWTSAGALYADIFADYFYNWRGSGNDVVEYEIANLPEGAFVFGEVFADANEHVMPGDNVNIEIDNDSYISDVLGRFNDDLRLPKTPGQAGWRFEVKEFNYQTVYTSLSNSLARVVVAGKRSILRLFERMRHNKAEEPMPAGFEYKLH